MESLAMPLEWIDWMRLFSHYLMLSLLSFGGITTATPELQHFLVEEQHWICLLYTSRCV